MADIRHDKALWRNPHTWYIAAIIVGCSIFYYLGTIIALTGWAVPQWGVFYTVYDLHRLLFVIPVLYAAYIFRVRGVIVTVLISMLIFVPRAIFISPYPQPLARSLVFIGVFGVVGALLALLLDNMAKVELLKRSEERLRTLVESGLDFLMIVNSDGTIRFASLSIERRLGYKPEELIDKNAFELIHQQDLPDFGDVFTELVHNPGVSQRIELRLQHKDGSWHAIEGVGRNLLNDPLVAGVVINCHDVTERKQAEEREKQLQKELNLASRLASVGRLAAGIAHEINNPLTAILGFSQRLLRKSTDAKVNRDLEIIRSEAQRAANVVENLLTFARRREPKKEYSDINDIVQKALQLRAYELKTNNIEVVTDLAPSSPKAMVDFHQIQQVFLNLILNAEQAMSEASRGGKLTIKTQDIKDYIRISFTDDGLGIPAEHLDKVFDPFFTTRGEGSGTGLGLSVCHGIVAEHGGRIYARSKPGKGTTFFVELPITTEEMDKSKVVEE
ncbi:MAG: ATP-binding protein [Dehalococcoidia bacterium]|nr:ATP-binding protein [Dehalococcoidia bacterium]